MCFDCTQHKLSELVNGCSHDGGFGYYVALAIEGLVLELCTVTTTTNLLQKVSDLFV